MSPAQLLDLFRERVTDYGAALFRCQPSELPDTIADALAARGVGRLVIPGGLPASWIEAIPEGVVDILRDGEPATMETGAGGEEKTHSAGEIGEGFSLSKHQMDSAHGALTGCALGIATTGTIALDGGPAQGRRMLTLLPDYHLCVVFGRQVIETVPEAVAKLAEAVRSGRSPITLISGPSATSDIELSRVEGVHGPRTLEVILVEET